MKGWPIFGCTPTGAGKGNMLAVIYHGGCKYTFKRKFTDDPQGGDEIGKLYDCIIKWLTS